MSTIPIIPLVIGLKTIIDLVTTHVNAESARRPLTPDEQAALAELKARLTTRADWMREWTP